MRSHGKGQDLPKADKDSPLQLVSYLFPFGRRVEAAFFCSTQLQGCPGSYDWLLLWFPLLKHLLARSLDLQLQGCQVFDWIAPELLPATSSPLN